MAADGLAKEGARSSSDMLLNQFLQKNPAPGPDGLN